jgi:hypothetical protein
MSQPRRRRGRDGKRQIGFLAARDVNARIRPNTTKTTCDATSGAFAAV